MPTPIALPAPRTPAAALRARAAQGQPGAAPAGPLGQDQLAIRRDQATIAWTRGKFNGIPALDNEALKALAAEAELALATPGHSKEAAGALHLLVSGAYGKLALNKVERKANGKRSYEALMRAVANAPGDVYVAQAYARGMYAIADRNWFVRKVVTSVLDCDLKANMREACKLLAQFPHDPTSQIVRERVADKIGDKAARAEARANIDRMGKLDPRCIADALRKLDGDSGLARAAEAEVAKEK